MDWYEPNEDSFAILDLLESEDIKNKVVLDLGCSTGVITSFLENNNLVISTDLNLLALDKIRDKNCIMTNLLNGINQSRIDVVVFNPPYVYDFDCKILGGGLYGKEIIDKFVDCVTIPIIYLLIIEVNKPKEIISRLEERYKVKIALVRKIINETIIILKCEIKR